MKIKTLLLLALVALFTASCSDDEKASVSDIQGIYEGYSLASCKYFTDNLAEEQSVTITANTDGTAKVEYVSGTFGVFTIPAATLSENGGVYTLTGSGQTQMGMSDKVTAYDCTVIAVVKSKTDANIKFEVPAVMGGLTIEFKAGKTPSE